MIKKNIIKLIGACGLIFISLVYLAQFLTGSWITALKIIVSLFLLIIGILMLTDVIAENE